MNDLLEKKILILDCQTTGMHPRIGSLLQIGWSVFDPKTLTSSSIEKRTLKLPPDTELPNKIKKMLQLSNDELSKSLEPKEVFEHLQLVLNQLGSQPIVLAHYAQFEQSFLKVFYREQTGSDELGFQLLCSQKIAKRLLPNLPSHNLKALAGFYKLAHTTKNEVTSHVVMTTHIWQQLLPKLINENLTSFSSLNTWLKLKTKRNKPSFYEYNIERLTRLELSENPGVYHMLAREGEILYIGKATSLKARVNSYFRGIKNRDRRKLEMLTQVWDIQTFECDTPLEAALLESDEIKKWNPPYNLLLKKDNRRIIFYNKEYTQYSESKDNYFYNGPYRPFDAVMNLIDLIGAIENHRQLPFEDLYSPEIIEQAWGLFCDTYGLEKRILEHKNWRVFFLIGHKILKQFELQHGKNNFEPWWLNEKKIRAEEELSVVQQLAQKIARNFLRAAESKRRSIQLKRLINTSLIIKTTQKKLTLVNGEFVNEREPRTHNKEIESFGIAHYDRLSILLSAKNKQIITSF